jgi:hypothetical protein
MSNFAQANEIKSLLIDVSEEIENKNLKKFIFTSLKLKNLIINKNHFVYINFISELKQYQILIFPTHYKNAIFQIYELFYLDKKELDSFDLYLAKDYFCLYKNGEFYYYQNIESEILINDLIEYINKNFSLKIDNYKIINNAYAEELKNDYLEKALYNKLINFNSKNSYGFGIFLFYILMLILTSSLFFLNNQIDSENKNEIVFENSFNKLKNEHLFISFSSNLNELLDLLNKYNLNLKTLEYKENRLKVVLSTPIKADIYSFFSELKTNLISNDINYFENEKIYESTIYVKLFK